MFGTKKDVTSWVLESSLKTFITMAAISILTPMLSLMPIIKKRIRSKEISQARDNGKIEKLRVQGLLFL